MNNQPILKQLNLFRTATDSVRDALVVTLIAFFILLYASVLTGWFRPISDLGFLNRIEPIIFLIIGYYFGRLPSERNERMLKDEIARQTRRGDIADSQVETLRCEREMLEERIRNTRSVLKRRTAPSRDSRNEMRLEPIVVPVDGRAETALQLLGSEV
jgi:hypothetical protein